MNLPPLEILYEDNHLLALNKPAGLPTMGVADDEPSLWRQARQYIKHRYRKPGNVYLGVMSRLDAPVSGVVLLARTSKAAARLTEQFRMRQVQKIYWAIVPGTIIPESAALVDWIVKDESRQRMIVLSSEAQGAKQARLTYRRLEAVGGSSLVEIELETGRKHQIRLQLAARGFPILGDRKYGSDALFPRGIALHARRLAIEHPVQRQELEFVAQVPPSWPRIGAGS